MFKDRRDAGRQLAGAVAHFSGQGDVIVLALPRGGVPVAYEVARAIGAPLDVFLVRKLGTPGQPELAMGAIASGGVVVMNDDVLRHVSVAPAELAAVTREETAELERRERAYRGLRPHPSLEGRVVILVDDGLATGSSMRAAVRAVRAQKPQRLVVAVPVGAFSTCEGLRGEADEVVCLQRPRDFAAVGHWYEDFSQTSDAEVQALLA